MHRHKKPRKKLPYNPIYGIIDIMKRCFECEKTEDQIEMHNHHVVPKSRGGTKTTPLCYVCHALVHDKKAVSSGYLIRQTHEERRSKGLVCGHPPYGFSRGENDELVENPEEQKIWDYVKKLRLTPLGKKKRHPWRAVADSLNGQGLTNRSGRSWSYRNLLQINKTKSKNYNKEL